MFVFFITCAIGVVLVVVMQRQKKLCWGRNRYDPLCQDGDEDDKSRVSMTYDDDFDVKEYRDHVRS